MKNDQEENYGFNNQRIRVWFISCIVISIVMCQFHLKGLLTNTTISELKQNILVFLCKTAISYRDIECWVSGVLKFLAWLGLIFR